jgi:hypothetical protein
VYLTDVGALYRYDVATNTVTKVGNYSCLAGTDHQMMTLALDSAGNMYGTTNKIYPPHQDYGELVKINPVDATCSVVVFNYTTGGIFPGDMEFFPAGMVEPGKETLVGMDSGEYVKVDTTSGDVTTLGVFSGQGQQTYYLGEGAVVAVGTKAYTRVTSPGGAAFLAEFKPTGTGPFSGNFVRVLNLNVPDAAEALVRVGQLIYAFGTDQGGTNVVVKIDPVAETAVSLAAPTGANFHITSAAAAPLAP